VFIVAQVHHSHARHLMMASTMVNKGVECEKVNEVCQAHLLILKVAISSVVLALLVAVESELTACTDLNLYYRLVTSVLVLSSETHHTQQTLPSKWPTPRQMLKVTTLSSTCLLVGSPLSSSTYLPATNLACKQSVSTTFNVDCAATYRHSWKSSLSHHEFLICTNTNGQV